MVPVDDLAEPSARSAPNSASKQKQAQDAEAALSIFAARRKAAEEQRVAHHRVAVAVAPPDSVLEKGTAVEPLRRMPSARAKAKMAETDQKVASPTAPP